MLTYYAAENACMVHATKASAIMLRKIRNFSIFLLRIIILWQKIIGLWRKMPTYSASSKHRFRAY